MTLLARRHSGHSHAHGAHETRGQILDRGWRYDLEVWLFDTFLVRGRVRELRQRVLDVAQLHPGGSLLDVGCGTGTLAVGAAARLGSSGRVVGVDPAPRQIARARSKARRARASVDFEIGVIEELPFADESFEVVTSTLMLHHLPDDLKGRGLAEIARVLKPGGLLVVADFDTASGDGATGDSSAVGHVPDLLANAGFTGVDRQAVVFPRTHHGWSGVTVLRVKKPE